MSVIVHLPPIRLSVSIPGGTPSSGLRNALEAIVAALATFPAKPGPEALGAALLGVAWDRHGLLVRVLPKPLPTARTSHVLTVDVTSTPTVSVTAAIFDEEDETWGQLHEGNYVLGSISGDLDAFVRALTGGA